MHGRIHLSSTASPSSVFFIVAGGRPASSGVIMASKQSKDLNRLFPSSVARNDPRLNPLYANLSGLPLIKLYYGTHDMLAGEAIEFGTRAKGFGRDVSLHSRLETSSSVSAANGERPGGCDRRSVSSRSYCRRRK
jgi:hypothetical protein